MFLTMDTSFFRAVIIPGEYVESQKDSVFFLLWLPNKLVTHSDLLYYLFCYPHSGSPGMRIFYGQPSVIPAWGQINAKNSHRDT
jgi:hypothetical protein